MASYDSEHSVPPSTSNTVPTASAERPPRRPDFSSFFSHVDAYTDTSQTLNANAAPMPSDVSAAYRMLAEGFERMRPYSGREGGDGLLTEMIQLLWRESERPPGQVEGVGQEFIDDPYPLVVRLPCNPKHMFDLECIAPWLKLHATCPLDRKSLVKAKKPATPPLKEDEEEDGEYDDMYA